MSTSGKRIAIVDDEPDMIEVISDFLQSEGVQCDCYTDPLKAYEALRAGTNGLDLILSDIRMKGMTGFQLLEKLKAEGLKTPLVFMSGHIDKTVKEEAISKGARAVLFKPFDFKEILQFFPS